MKQLAGSLMICASVLTLAVWPATAQDKAVQPSTGKTDSKVILENDKVRVLETTWKPGDESTSRAYGARVVRALKGGTLTRIYPDGKREASSFKDGEVRWIDATPPYAIKNETNAAITLYSVYPK